MNRNGQALIEYLLIVAVISVIVIAMVSYFGGYLKDSITKSSCSLINEEYIKGKKPGDGKCSDEQAETIFSK